jgi:hypothetical protein
MSDLSAFPITKKWPPSDPDRMQLRTRIHSPILATPRALGRSCSQAFSPDVSGCAPGTRPPGACSRRLDLAHGIEAHQSAALFVPEFEAEKRSA